LQKDCDERNTPVRDRRDWLTEYEKLENFPRFPARLQVLKHWHHAILHAAISNVGIALSKGLPIASYEKARTPMSDKPFVPILRGL
jgi:hypothetical protein